MEQIENYIIIPVGRSKDLTNQIFGDFQVIYRTEPLQEVKTKKAYWLCQCIKCKKYKVKPFNTLLSGANQCDCKYDLTGKKFGRLTVQYLTDKRTKNRGKIWHCICECGNEKDIPAETLAKGESNSCGCLQKELTAELGRMSRKDLTGQRFGKLVALYPIYSNNREKHTIWHCQCDCGNECNIDMGNLRSGKSKSCGCTNSHQEENIIKLLTSNNIKFVYQKIFTDFTNKRFDFWVQDKNYIIEFDGMQHFFAKNSGWNTEENLQNTRNSDLLKNKYCFEHNIPIIRIPYSQSYTIKDLKLETTRFLITPENQYEYYEKYK